MGGKELGIKKVGKLNLREEAARVTLRTVRQQGHVYIQLRKVTKRSIFFCTLCLTPCFSEAVLYDHLRGNLHSKRYNSAKITLLLPNPWPFNDGVLFFDNSREKDIGIAPVSKPQRNLGFAVNDEGSGAPANADEETSKSRDTCNQDLTEKIKKCKGVQENFSISYVLPNEQISNLELKILGYGHIGAKIYEDNEKNSKFSRIWCAWLGDGNSEDCDELLASPKCDFAIANISYTYALGKSCANQYKNRPSFPRSFFEIDESKRRTKKRKKSFSDPKVSSEAFAERRASACEKKRKKSFSDPKDSSEAFAERSASPSHNVGCCSQDKSHHGGVRRKELKKQICTTSKRCCGICQQPLLFGKDVATLLNLKTGRFACSSRNINGAFHVFHVSCLIHWVLLSEFELWAKQSMNPRSTRGRKGKASVKNNLISSIHCPDCLATGIHVEGDALEHLYDVLLPEPFRYKLKAFQAHKAWMKSPENLQKCSTGLCFPSEPTVKLEGKVSPAKLLLFYRAAE